MTDAGLLRQARDEACPTRARALLDAAIDHGWAAAWQPGFDTSGAPFVTVRAVHRNTGAAADTEIRVTWHTRATGTYRLFSAIAREPGRNWHDITLTQAEAIIRRAAT